MRLAKRGWSRTNGILVHHLRELPKKSASLLQVRSEAACRPFQNTDSFYSLNCSTETTATPYLLNVIVNPQSRLSPRLSTVGQEIPSGADVTTSYCQYHSRVRKVCRGA